MIKEHQDGNMQMHECMRLLQEEQTAVATRCSCGCSFITVATQAGDRQSQRPPGVMLEEDKDFSTLYLSRQGNIQYIFERFWVKRRTLIISEKIIYVRCLIISQCQRNAGRVCVLCIGTGSALLGCNHISVLKRKKILCHQCFSKAWDLRFCD